MPTLKKNPRAGSLPDPEGSPFPHTDREFFSMFGTEEQCREHLHSIRWPNGFVCPVCGTTEAWWLPSSNQYKCENDHKTSLTSGTVMHKTRQNICDWYYAAWLFCSHSQSVSALQLMRKCNAASHNGMWGMLHKLRAALVEPNHRKLHGSVEIDETYVGGKESGVGVRGRGARKKALVAVAVEFDNKTNRQGADYLHCLNCRMKVIPNAQTATMMRFVQDNVDVGSTVCTDALRSYYPLEALGYRHSAIVASRTADPLPAVGRVATNLKRWIAGILRYAIRKQHVQAYLNEWVFRFNHRDDPWTMFHTALGLLGSSRAGPTYRGLSNRRWVHQSL